MGRGLQPHWGTRGSRGEGLLGFRGHHGELGAGGRADREAERRWRVRAGLRADHSG